MSSSNTAAGASSNGTTTANIGMKHRAQRLAAVHPCLMGRPTLHRPRVLQLASMTHKCNSNHTNSCDAIRHDKSVPALGFLNGAQDILSEAETATIGVTEDKSRQ